MKQLSWVEAFLVALTLAFVGLLIIGLTFSESRQSALALISSIVGIAVLTVLAKLVSKLGARLGRKG